MGSCQALVREADRPQKAWPEFSKIPKNSGPLWGVFKPHPLDWFRPTWCPGLHLAYPGLPLSRPQPLEPQVTSEWQTSSDPWKRVCWGIIQPAQPNWVKQGSSAWSLPGSCQGSWQTSKGLAWILKNTKKQWPSVRGFQTSSPGLVQANLVSWAALSLSRPAIEQATATWATSDKWVADQQWPLEEGLLGHNPASSAQLGKAGQLCQVSEGALHSGVLASVCLYWRLLPAIGVHSQTTLLTGGLWQSDQSCQVHWMCRWAALWWAPSATPVATSARRSSWRATRRLKAKGSMLTGPACNAARRLSGVWARQTWWAVGTSGLRDEPGQDRQTWTAVAVATLSRGRLRPQAPGDQSRPAQCGAHLQRLDSGDARW